MNQQTCNPAWLDAFLKNDLNQREEQMLTSHLDECSDCREELESLAAEQSVWREASNMLGGSILLSTAAIGDIRSSTVRSPQIELVLKQLAPTDDPESLGRIGGYEVTGVVGAGGMGVVLKAHDRSLDRIVAIKVMSPHLASSGSARRRFAREAKAAAAVLHPNVIAIHSVASEDANPFLVMPYVRGASLQKRIDSQGPLPLKDTLRIGAQIAAGLAAAHEQGLVHRDIKPANILLEEGVERVTITDFGLARAVDDASMTCSGVIAGTPQYMSPEQTRGEPIDARSDLFSLGSVLYAMCAGRSPFRAETTYGVLHRIANDNPTPVCEVNTDVPVWLGQIVERLMAKRPEDRFESAAQVAELLEGCLAHVQQPAAIPLPVGVQALAAQAQLRAGEIPKPNRLKAIHQRIPPFAKYIAAAAGAFALFFAGILIVLELDKGTLTIESELDDVPIRIMQGDEVVKSLTVSKEGATTRIGAGKYIVEIGQEFDKAVIKDGSVELSRGATAIVKVTQTNADTAESEKAKDEAAKAWLRRPVVGRTRDGKSYQLAGHNALMDCVMRNNSETLNRLLTVDKYDLDFSPRDGQWTLLQIALLHECVETTSLLLQHGANPNFASKGTPQPLELAKRSGRKQLLTLVQKHLESAPPVISLTSDTLTLTDVEKIMEGLLNADLLRQPSAIDKSKEPSQTVQLDGHAMDFLLGLKGDWKLDAISFDGGKLGNVPRSKMSATIRPTLAGNNLEMFIGSQQMGPAFEIGILDTSTTPMQITLNRYGTYQALLSFEDEVLTLAQPIRPGEPRPQSLQPAKGIVIYRWTRMSEQAQDRDSFLTIPLKAEWVPEEWLKRNMGRRHLTIVADGNIQDEAKPNVVNRVQRGILHDCRLESYEKTSRDGVEYWNARFFVPRKPVYSLGALWFKDAIRNDRIGDRHTGIPSPDLTQDNPQVKLDEAMKEGHVFRLDYVNDDFENNLPMVKSQKAESTSIQETADSDSVNPAPTTSGFELTEQQIQRVIGAQSARIVRALDTPVDLVVDGKSSLAEIVSGIVREHRISVRLNEKSFEEQGVAIHHVPAFEVHGVTLKSALTTLLEKLLQHRSIPPVIEVRHGVLTLAAKAPSDIINDLARSKPTSVVFQSMGQDKQALPETVVEVQGSDGVYFVLSDQNGLAPVVGHGVSNWYTTARDASGQLMAYKGHGMFLSKPTKPYVLNFTAPQSLAVNVSDEHGRPIEGATVGILAERCRYQITDALGRAEFKLPISNHFVQAIFALKSGKGLDYISYQPQWATDLPRELSLQLVGARELKVRLLDEQNQLLKGVPIFPVKFDFLNPEDPKAEKSLSWWKLAMGAVDWSATNEQGEVVFDWLPRDQVISFLTTNRELEHNTLNVTDLAEDVVEFRMTGPVEVSGRVLDIDGKPVAGASIAANNESGASANTDEEGRYVLKVRPGSTFYLEAVDSAGGGWMAKRRGISDWVEAVAGQPSKNNDVVIRPTAHIFGRVTYTFDSAPAANIQLSYQFDGPPGRDPIKFKEGAVMSRGYGINGYTDDDGRFEFYAVPGKYTVSAVPDSGLRAEQEFAVVGTEPHEANMSISKIIPVKGRVLAGDPPMPMGRVTIKRKHLTDPFNLSGYDWSINEAGELDVEIRDRDPMILWGHIEDKQLWGITDMAWDDAEFEMKLAPRAEMKVRILDSDQKPVANTEFTYGVFRRIQPQYQKEEDRQDINVHSIEPREGTTDENGILKLKDLIVGGDYIIHMTSSHSKFEEYPDSPIPQAKVLVDSMAKDVVVDVVMRKLGFDKFETTNTH